MIGLLCNGRKAQAVEEMLPLFSDEGGFYEQDFILTLSCEEGSKIYYTLDSCIPEVGNHTTFLYTEGIPITYGMQTNKKDRFSLTVVRAIVCNAEGEYGPVVTKTYFRKQKLSESYLLPTISLVTDPDNLYNELTGIFVHTQERGDKWERPIHIEYLDESKTLAFSMNVGVRLHGGASRDFPYKSLRLYARKEYDEQKKFSYDFFSDNIIPAYQKNGAKDKIVEFKRLILRNCGNEGNAWDSTFFRDAFTQSLMVNTNLDLQAYQPAIVYLNGNYYGIMNIRERLDQKYLAQHYKVAEEEVTIYGFWCDGKEQMTYIDEGKEEDLEFYQTMYDFVKTQDMTLPKNYEQVAEWLDIDSYIDYNIIQIYSNNGDWPGNNCKAWRYTGEVREKEYGLDGKIRYLLFDTDFSFGLYNHSASEDALARAIEVGSTEWPNQDGSTLLFRTLLKNDTFRTKFCNRYMDLINSNFIVSDSKKRIEELQKYYEPYTDEFRDNYYNLGTYRDNIHAMSQFVERRGYFAQRELKNHLQAGNTYQLTVQVNETMQGIVQVNSLIIDSENHHLVNNQWKGKYLENIPVIVTADANPGYVFAGWEGREGETSSVLILEGDKVKQDVLLTPIFITEEAYKMQQNENEITVESTQTVQQETTEVDGTDGMTHMDISKIIICAVSVIILGGFLVLRIIISKKRKR